MNKTSSFLAGIILGFIICYHFFRAPEIKQEKRKVAEITEAKEQVPPKPRRKIAKATITTTEMQAEPKVIDLKPEQFIQTAEQKPKKRIEINFSETTVRNMEEQWQRLPYQTQVTAEARGWRIKMLTPDSAFAQAGLNQGDLITKDFLETMSHDSDPGLSRRLERILQQITIN